MADKIFMLSKIWRAKFLLTKPLKLSAFNIKIYIAELTALKFSHFISYAQLLNLKKNFENFDVAVRIAILNFFVFFYTKTWFSLQFKICHDFISQSFFFFLIFNEELKKCLLHRQCRECTGMWGSHPLKNILLFGSCRIKCCHRCQFLKCCRFHLVGRALNLWYCASSFDRIRG